MDIGYWRPAVITTQYPIPNTHKVHIPQGEGYHENHYFAGCDQFPVHDVAGVATALPTCYDQDYFPC